MENCLFCGASVEDLIHSSHKPLDGRTDQLKPELIVYFVVRNLLNLTSKECESLLVTFGNPSKWLVFCDNCQELIAEAKKVSEMIGDLEKMLESKRRCLKRRMCEIEQDERRNTATSRIRKSVLQSLGRESTKVTEPNVLLPVLSDEIKEEIEPYSSSQTDDSLDSIPGNESVPISQDQSYSGHESTQPDFSDSLELDSLKRYKCPKCDSSFQHSYGLTSHLKQQHWITDNHLTFSMASNRIRVVRHYSQQRKRKCPHCGTLLETLEELRNHLIDVHELAACKFCPRLFNSSRGLNLHILNCHQKLDRRKDDKNGKLVKKKIVERKTLPREKRVRQRDTRLFECPHCPSRIFNRKGQLSVHLRTVHFLKLEGFEAIPDNPLYPASFLRCDKCPGESNNDQNFASLEELANHKVEVHGMIKCDLCPRVFFGLGYLDNHKKKQHRNGEDKYSQSVDIDKLVVNASEVTRQSGGTGWKLTQCKYCAEKFDTKKDLTEHGVSVHPEEMHKCDKCPDLFDRLKPLYDHKTIVHGEPNKPYRCPFCSYSHKFFVQIHKHREAMHETRKRLVCEYCSEAFVTESYLKYHKAQKHGESRPNLQLTCTICNKTYSTPSYLKSHIKHVHMNASQYKCPHCGTGCRGSLQLKRHVNAVHLQIRPFKCTEEGCPKDYGSSSLLSAHFRRVHGPKNFKCSQCTSAYGDNADLRRHIRESHATSNVAQCEHCGKGFKAQKLLTQHRRQVHKIYTKKYLLKLGTNPVDHKNQ